MKKIITLFIIVLSLNISAQHTGEFVDKNPLKFKYKAIYGLLRTEIRVINYVNLFEVNYNNGLRIEYGLRNWNRKRINCLIQIR